VIFHLSLGGAGTALLARAWRQALPAAATAAVAFALAPPVTAVAAAPDHLYAVVWMPWQVFLLHRLLASDRPWRWAILLGVCTALQMPWNSWIASASDSVASRSRSVGPAMYSMTMIRRSPRRSV
jgi:hypothetical protein